MDKWAIVCAVVALCVSQVPAQFAEADFVENLKEPPSGRIVSGWEAYPGQHPWHIAIRMVTAVGAVSSCGGSLIHHSWAITAAHCTATRVTIVVRAGVTNLTTPVYLSETTTWFNYPTFDNNQPMLVQPNDISLLKLGARVSFSDLVKPIRVQPQYEAFNSFDREVLIASGHGRTWTNGPQPEVLHWVYLRGVSNPACGAVFGALITDTTICAQYYNVTSQSVCNGDSGGPLVHTTSSGEPVLVGVASFVAGGQWGCHSGLPAGFCRVGPFLSWFREVSGVDFENIEESEEEESEEDPKEESEEDPKEESEESEEDPKEESEEDPKEESEEDSKEDPKEESEEDSKEDPKEESEEDSKEESEEDDSKEKPDEDSKETEEDDSDDSDDSDECGDDKRCKELLKKLDVKVKVHVRLRARRRWRHRLTHAN